MFSVMFFVCVVNDRLVVDSSSNNWRKIGMFFFICVIFWCCWFVMCSDVCNVFFLFFNRWEKNFDKELGINYVKCCCCGNIIGSCCIGSDIIYVKWNNVFVIV